jgi:hypothetical protein
LARTIGDFPERRCSFDLAETNLAKPMKSSLSLGTLRLTKRFRHKAHREPVPTATEEVVSMNHGLLTVSDPDALVPDRAGKGWPLEKLGLPLVYLLASFHLVWFYINRVPSFLVLERYETGSERMPFQARLMMEYPLRWAHASPTLNSVAAGISAIHLWIPRGVLPEDFVEAAVDLISVVIAGLVATDLYRGHSRTRLLTPYVYPLALVMMAGSYCLGSINFYRYVYDLPSLGLFSAGLYLVFHRHHPALFALLFMIATVNRETSIFLLYFFLVSSCVSEAKVVWRRALSWRAGGTATLLAVFWLSWHIWTKRHFAGLAVERGPGAFVNFACLILPLAWPQLAGIAAYTLPAVLIYRRELRSMELRLWLWVFPFWFACMMCFGNLIETRLFGELIPLFACTAALVAEEGIYRQVRSLESTAIPGPARLDP